MAKGFRGTRVALSQIALKATEGVVVIKLTAQFRDTEGVVHGETTHAISLSEEHRESPLYVACKEFLVQLQQQVTGYHFEDTEGDLVGPTKQVGTHGIAEALRGSAGASDDFGEQG